MDEIIAHIEELSKLSPYIKLYRNFDPKIILKHIGKITGEIDRQYVDFLLKTNGASILDYCFLGLKNHNLGMNIYDNMRELWFLDCSLAMRFGVYAEQAVAKTLAILIKWTAPEIIISVTIQQTNQSMCILLHLLSKYS